MQAQVDAAIEFHVGSEGWKAADMNLLAGHKPARRSLAAPVGGNGELYDYALDALDRTRAGLDQRVDAHEVRHQVLAPLRGCRHRDHPGRTEAMEIRPPD
jgi:hypothetical protein